MDGRMKSMVVTAKDDAFQQQYIRWIRAKTLQVLLDIALS
jgi:hypothetical protein